MTCEQNKREEKKKLFHFEQKHGRTVTGIGKVRQVRERWEGQGEGKLGELSTAQHCERRTRGRKGEMNIVCGRFLR